MIVTRQFMTNTGIDLKNHFCLKNTEQLKAINKPLELLGLDSFCFTSIDIKTSERFILTDHPQWTQFAYSGDFYSNEIIKKIETTNIIESFIWDDFAANQNFDIFLQNAKAHGLKHGITLMYYTADRLNMYYASTSRALENDKVLLDIKDPLTDFIPYFHYAAKDLIAESAKHAFIVRKNQTADTHLVDSEKLKLFYDAIKIKQLVINAQGDHLTHQETLCVYLSISGKNNKQISEQLRISVRTVEKHISNSRKKLNIPTHESLLSAILESQYFNHMMIYGKRYLASA